jgi:hypothetical protein
VGRVRRETRKSGQKKMRKMGISSTHGKQTKNVEEEETHFFFLGSFIIVVEMRLLQKFNL